MLKEDKPKVIIVLVCMTVTALLIAVNLNFLGYI